MLKKNHLVFIIIIIAAGGIGALISRLLDISGTTSSETTIFAATETTTETTMTWEECIDIYVPTWDDCFEGPNETVDCICACYFDNDEDNDIDLEDYAQIQTKSESWLDSYVKR